MKAFLCSLLLLFAFSLGAQAPVAVPLPKEPHHHLLLENSYVRVFRVSVPPHEATLLHQHDVPYVYVALGPGDVINAVAGKTEARLLMTDGQVGYSRGGFAHVARTDSGLIFNNVTIELLKPQGEPRNLCAQVIPDGAAAPCGTTPADKQKSYFIEPQFETEEITVDQIQIGPKAGKLGTIPQTESLLVALNESEIKIEVEGQPTKTLGPGEVIWLNAGSLETVSIPGKRPCRYLQVSFKDSGATAKP
jgi:hypothetical protein